MKKYREKPSKLTKKLSLNVTLIVFISLLLVIATGILFYIFWDNIVNFMTKSGTLLVLVAAIVIICGASAFAVSKIKGHNGDDY